ncbi:MAG TPA: nuclear transport factor 2 family protein [Thermoanaerobaculia bacterium]
MSETDDSLAIKEQITASLRGLFEAENPGGNREAAAEFFAPDCIPIIRGSGQKAGSRDEMLKSFGTRPDFYRYASRAVIEVTLFLENQLAIATTILPTIDVSGATPAMATYCNTHVLLRRDDEWKCISWQVTKQESFPRGIVTSLLGALER